MNPTAVTALPHTSRPSRLAAATGAALLAMTTLIGLGPVLESAGLPGAPDPVAATGPHLIATSAQIAGLPKSGAAWRSLKEAADSSAGTPNLSNQDSNNDVLVLAKALVYAKTKIASYRSSVLTNLKAVVGTEVGGRALAAGRGIPAYVIAADLISLPTWQPTFNTRTFRPWLKKLLTENLDGDTLISTNNLRPENWGTHAGAARVAIDVYLGNKTDLAKAARVFHGLLGDRASYAGFNYGDDLSWQCNPSKPVGINPTCTKSGENIDGAIPDEMRRGAAFQWPPTSTSYPWEMMQGAVLEAELLQRAGYPAWTWNSKALLRATKFLYRIGWPADSNDDWQPWLIDYRYGTTYRTAAPAHFGKNFGWTDWLYGTRVKGSTGPWHSYGDSSGSVVYHGSWSRSSSPRHIGGWVHASRITRSKAVFKFLGDQVVWLGPKGPAYGKAAVYIDGTLVKVVNLHTAGKHYRQKLFSATFDKVGTHYLTIKVLGTPVHPLVAVDGYLVHR